MSSTAQSYFEVALDHLATAQKLFDDADYENQYYLAHLFSGLAVECMLRAYLRRKTDQFEARHDLYQLASEAGFLDLVPKRERDPLGAALTLLNRRWRSNHRYLRARDLERHLQAVGAEKGVSGDLLANNADTMLVTATEIPKLGERKWRK